MVDFFIRTRNLPGVFWHDLIGAGVAAVGVVVWVTQGRSLEVLPYAALAYLVVHSFISVEVVGKRQVNRTKAEKAIADNRKLVVAGKWNPSGLENKTSEHITA